MRKYFRTVKCTLNMHSWGKKREVINIYNKIPKTEAEVISIFIVNVHKFNGKKNYIKFIFKK